LDRAYGRPAQSVTVTQGIDPGEPGDGDVPTLEHLILERIQVERGS
jgi:hypothetical protein